MVVFAVAAAGVVIGCWAPGVVDRIGTINRINVQRAVEAPPPRRRNVAERGNYCESGLLELRGSAVNPSTKCCTMQIATPVNLSNVVYLRKTTSHPNKSKAARVSTNVR